MLFRSEDGVLERTAMSVAHEVIDQTCGLASIGPKILMRLLALCRNTCGPNDVRITSRMLDEFDGDVAAESNGV